MKKYLPMLGAGALSVFLLLGGMFLGTRINPRPGGVPQEASEAHSAGMEYAVGGVGSIAIPGYDKLTCQAGALTQYVPLENPSENECYFVISIVLPDGTEIYKSGMVAPGAIINCLRLRAVPVAGVYENTILKYSCWNVGDDGELSEVNGANTLFTLEVIP